MKKKLLALALLAGGSMFAQTRFSFGVNIGSGPSYYAPAPVRIIRPPYPGRGYVWVDGHWAVHRFGRTWVPGHWAAPNFSRYSVAPRYNSYNNYDRGNGYGYNR